MRVEEYISKIGMETADKMKFALHSVLKARYEKEHDADSAGRLAADVVNYLFETQDAYYSSCKNLELAKSNAKRISEWADEHLCGALTCAVYNHCYAEYVRAGGKIGWLGSQFLGYFRAVQKDDFASKNLIFKKMVSADLCNSVLPFMALKAARLWRNLPNTPDSKELYMVVAAYAAAGETSNSKRQDAFSI